MPAGSQFAASGGNPTSWVPCRGPRWELPPFSRARPAPGRGPPAAASAPEAFPHGKSALKPQL